MKNLKYVIGAVVVVVLAYALWQFTTKPSGDSGVGTGGEQTNGDSTGKDEGKRACSNLISASELNSIFGVNNFSLQVNSGVNCIWATGDIKSGIGSNILALSLNVAKIGATAISLGESTIAKSASPISGVAQAYLLKDSGVVMFSGDYMYSFGTNDAGHSTELTALAKLIANKN